MKAEKIYFVTGAALFVVCVLHTAIGLKVIEKICSN